MTHLADVLAQLREPQPTIEPGVYESPIEHAFAHHATKYFRRGLWLQTQVPAGPFRLDFVFNDIGFECDGYDFHSSRAQIARDTWRDEQILASCVVRVVYRIPGRCLIYRPEDCFYAISRWDRELFSNRGLVNVEQLASREIQRRCERGLTSPLHFQYHHDATDEDPPDLTSFAIVRKTAR